MAELTTDDGSTASPEAIRCFEEERNEAMSDQTTDHLSAAVTAAAKAMYGGTSKAALDRARAVLTVASPYLATYYEDKGAAKEHAEVVRLREYGAERSPSELKNRNAALLLKVEELTADLAAAEDKGRSEERERLTETLTALAEKYEGYADSGEHSAIGEAHFRNKAKTLREALASLDSDQEVGNG
jgi:hypothetical protein